jgi:hypothetical protein
VYHSFRSHYLAVGWPVRSLTVAGWAACHGSQQRLLLSRMLAVSSQLIKKKGSHCAHPACRRPLMHSVA